MRPTSFRSLFEPSLSAFEHLSIDWVKFLSRTGSLSICQRMNDDVRQKVYAILPVVRPSVRIVNLCRSMQHIQIFKAKAFCKEALLTNRVGPMLG